MFKLDKSGRKLGPRPKDVVSRRNYGKKKRNKMIARVRMRMSWRRFKTVPSSLKF